MARSFFFLFLSIGVSSAFCQKEAFSWSKLPAVNKLEWTDCLPQRQCARLVVPLDYSDAHGRQASIALIRIPASVPADSVSYRGPVLFNPGGPGVSGVGFIGGPDGDSFAAILGPQFDVVGFDPRGVGHSTPRASIFKTDVERALWGLAGTPVLNNSADVARTWARSSVIGQLAAEQDDGYLRHINTDQTARDMLSIVNASGRGKLQYWGFSYGTVLGATFAAMFPDRIERMVLDGVGDAEDYYSTSWTSNLLDTDKAMDTFFSGCFNAGPSSCAFHALSAGEIRQNLINLSDRLSANPIPVKTNSTYGVFDYASLRIVLFGALALPYAYFPLLAQGLADLKAGNAELLFQALNPPGSQFQCSCDPNAQEHAGDSVPDAQLAIVCNDGDAIPADLESSQKYFAMMTQSSDWADVWSATRLNCVGWPKSSIKHFRGPFEGNTSHPILFIGNTADPVTPLAGALKMSRGFEGSVVLTQNSAGHRSFAAPSLCTQMHAREYFVNGTLPVADTVCQPEGTPFIPPV